MGQPASGLHLQRPPLLDQGWPHRGGGGRNQRVPPARTVYRLTPEGDDEFLRLLRDAIWRFEPFQAGLLQAGLSMMPYLSRVEVVAAMRHRLGLLEGFLKEAAFGMEAMRASVATPEHVTEQLLLIMGRVKGEGP